MSSSIQAKNPRALYIGALMWVSSIQYYIIQVIVGLKWEGNSTFSLTENTISDLGNTVCGTYGSMYVCSPQHQLMNLSFIIVGITQVLGAILLRRYFGTSILASVGVAGMVLAGIGTIVVGLYPENTVGSAHTIGAALPFLFGNIALISLGLTRRTNLLFKIFIAIGALALVALLFFLAKVYLGIGIGGMERVVAYPQSIFMTVVGFYLLLRKSEK